MIKKIAVTIALFAGLSGCIPKWQHPTKNETDFNSDKYKCLQESQHLFPPTNTNTTYTRLSNPTTNTKCTGYGNNLNCTSTQSPGIVAPSYSFDTNAFNRDQAFDTCMQSAGWKIVKDDAPEPSTATNIFSTEMKNLISKRNQVCEKPEYQDLFKLSPCLLRNSTLEHLSDSNKLPDDLKTTFAKFRQEAELLSREHVTLVNRSGSDRDKKVIQLIQKKEISENQLHLDLYNQKITIGEYNQARKKLDNQLALDVAEVK